MRRAAIVACNALLAPAAHARPGDEAAMLTARLADIGSGEQRGTAANRKPKTLFSAGVAC